MVVVVVTSAAALQRLRIPLQLRALPCLQRHDGIMIELVDEQ